MSEARTRGWTRWGAHCKYLVNKETRAALLLHLASVTLSRKRSNTSTCSSMIQSRAMSQLRSYLRLSHDTIMLSARSIRRKVQFTPQPLGEFPPQEDLFDLHSHWEGARSHRKLHGGSHTVLFQRGMSRRKKLLSPAEGLTIVHKIAYLTKASKTCCCPWRQLLTLSSS